MLISSIIKRMKRLIRIRRIVKIVFDETNKPTGIVTQSTDQAPTYQYVLKQFEKLNDKYDEDLANITMTMATKADYLNTRKSRDKDYDQIRVVVTGDGLNLLTPTYFFNELAGSIGKISPLVTIILSIAAIIISIIALHKR